MTDQWDVVARWLSLADRLDQYAPAIRGAGLDEDLAGAVVTLASGIREQIEDGSISLKPTWLTDDVQALLVEEPEAQRLFHLITLRKDMAFHDQYLDFLTTYKQPKAAPYAAFLAELKAATEKLGVIFDREPRGEAWAAEFDRTLAVCTGLSSRIHRLVVNGG